MGTTVGLAVLGAGWISQAAAAPNDVPAIDISDRAAVTAAFTTYYEPQLDPPQLSGWTGSVLNCDARPSAPRPW